VGPASTNTQDHKQIQYQNTHDNLSDEKKEDKNYNQCDEKKEDKNYNQFIQKSCN
jgi:hypothetical protein